MRVLVTGMTSRMTSFNREVGFPSLLARALSNAGHEVTMHVEHSGVESYDAVIAGIASPLSPSSTYFIPTAQTIDEASERGTLKAVFIDDYDADKIVHGSNSVLRKPERLERPFFSTRPGSEALKESDSLRRTVNGVVERMAAWSWDTILWPAHLWGAGASFANSRKGLLGIDVSPALHQLLAERVDSLDARASVDLGNAYWLGEITYFPNPKWDPSVSKAMFEASTGDTHITQMIRAIMPAYGLIQGSDECPGWWTPFPSLSALTSTLYIPHPDEGELMGEPYYLLPHTVENCSADEYVKLADQQIEYFKENLCITNSSLSRMLNGVLGQPSN